jgi:hypothetical protein
MHRPNKITQLGNHLEEQMNPSGNSGVGGSDVPPSSQHQQMQNAVDLTTGDHEFLMLRNIIKDKM